MIKVKKKKKKKANRKFVKNEKQINLRTKRQLLKMCFT